ncbi:DNA methyltransferase [Shigella flexneri]
MLADPPYNIGKNFDGLNRSLERRSVIDWLFEVIAECHRVLKKQGSMYIMNSTENMPLSISSAASFLPSKVASSGHMTVLEYRRKTLRLHVRTHPDDGERRKELHIQR